MARSLKVIGTIISVMMSSSSALSIVGPPTSATTTAVTPAISRTFGGAPFVADTLDVVRRAPATSVNTLRMSATTIERPKTTERVVEKTRKRARAPAKERKQSGSESWEVRIYNDVMNTREFVARCLVQLVGLSEMAAYQTMMQAHQNGLAVVGRYAFERAEMYHEALTSNGIMCDMIPVDDKQ